VRSKKSGDKDTALQRGHDISCPYKRKEKKDGKRDGLKPAPTTAARLRRRALRVLIRPPADPRRIGRDGRMEFAGDEGVQGAEPGGELGSSQTAVVVEPAEMTFRG